MGRPELAVDPRFRSARGRRDNNEALKEIIESWLAGFPTRDEALAALDKERVACAPVLSLNEAMEHPHLRARNTVRRVKDRFLGELDIPGVPVKFSAWPDQLDLRAALLGEDNERVLQDVLELPEDKIRALYSEGVLVRDPVLEAEPQTQAS
jgi:CoA:oxalate CoA-transferase